MSGNWLQRLSLFAILINVSAVGIHYYLSHRFYSAAGVPAGTQITPLTGRTGTSTEITVENAMTYDCHVLRYTSTHCQWCRQDESAWQTFESAFLRRGCDSFLLGPSAADLPQDAVSAPNRHWLAIVPATVAAEVNLFATPTTVVFDRQWKVKWSKMGIFEKGDMERAIRSIR
jgi:hypothetical protein